MLTDSVPHNHVAIIGTGFGAIATAARLQRAGFDDLVLIDRASDVGGVWRDNSYPGAAVDVKSHLYSLSFAPNPDWHNVFAKQPELRRRPPSDGTREVCSGVPRDRHLPHGRPAGRSRGRLGRPCRADLRRTRPAGRTTTPDLFTADNTTLIRGVGHTPPSEAPERIAELILTAHAIRNRD